MELSSEVREIIEDYLQDRKLKILGYESHGINTFRDECKDFFDGFNWNRILKIKNDCCQFSKADEYRYYQWLDKKSQTYFDGSYNYKYLWCRVNGFRGTQTDYLASDCVRYFRDNIMDLINPYINEKYGNLEKAISSTNSFIELWNGFDEWFNEKRNNFMAKMEIDIQKQNAIQKRKTPQSHGGVANLLKVLTKTMQTQGADIRSIAKVQYAVCTQAGIYIPDEFIRDVAVALDITEEVANVNEL